MGYAKDTHFNGQQMDMRATFGKVDQIACDLMNSCRYAYKDKGGEYLYRAVLSDKEGFVKMIKEYKS